MSLIRRIWIKRRLKLKKCMLRLCSWTSWSLLHLYMKFLKFGLDVMTHRVIPFVFDPDRAPVLRSDHYVHVPVPSPPHIVTKYHTHWNTVVDHGDTATYDAVCFMSVWFVSFSIQRISIGWGWHWHLLNLNMSRFQRMLAFYIDLFSFYLEMIEWKTFDVYIYI